MADRQNSLEKFRETLPYSSELFGIFQPVLGWKSKRIKLKHEKDIHDFHRNFIAQIAKAPSNLKVNIKNVLGDNPEIILPESIHISNFNYVNKLSSSFNEHDSIAIRMISKDLHSEINNVNSHNEVKNKITPKYLKDISDKILKALSDTKSLEKNSDISSYVKQFFDANKGVKNPEDVFKGLLEKEMSVIGYINLISKNFPEKLIDLFKSKKAIIEEKLKIGDPLLSFGHNNYKAILSPIGMVHLYRQYFFEFESFLGPSVGHVWISPGGTVELIETSTRRNLKEFTSEASNEITNKTELSSTNQDDLSDAIKEENRSNTKFGFSNTMKGSFFSIADHETKTDFSYDRSRVDARESTHKTMRQQSEKLSSEIKKNYKTTFKTSTDVTDTSSKRYVLTNNTSKLVNYELRRKMRTVGVQVQDIGVQLCWQTFVDDPGSSIGISQLVHLAQPADLNNFQQPDSIPLPKPIMEERTITIPFIGKDTSDRDNRYRNGNEIESLIDNEHIVADFPQTVYCKSAQYILDSVIPDVEQNDMAVSIRDISSTVETDGKATFTVHLDDVHFHGKNSIPLKVTLVWKPSEDLVNSIKQENENRVKDYSLEKLRREKEAYVNSVKDRIKMASEVKGRNSDDLREEERIVIFRNLISQLLSVTGSDLSAHVMSELIRSIFDVDKMLYFVSPEWWTPRLHKSKQDFDSTSNIDNNTDNQFNKSSVIDENSFSWGGSRENGRDNYLITENSNPAKLGSSLGWLMQLDGDDLRNSFLNSPWVKAVIPIRLGKEKEALNWLKQAHVEGVDGLDSEYFASEQEPARYHSSPQHRVTIEKAINLLADDINGFNSSIKKPISSSNPSADTLESFFHGSLPTEAVFEKGFYPLKNGVKFDEVNPVNIFSQWTEILPTDQVVAMEVEYDPKTLRIKEP